MDAYFARFHLMAFGLNCSEREGKNLYSVFGCTELYIKTSESIHLFLCFLNLVACLGLTLLHLSPGPPKSKLCDKDLCAVYFGK